MGVIEELEETEVGECPICNVHAETKCTGCKKVFYCSRDCQKKHWKVHKSDCKMLPYKICENSELGKYLIANKDLKEGDIIVQEAPLVVGPVPLSPPVCICCYTLVDGSFKCRKSGWPVCGPTCEKAVAHNPEVVVPHQTEARFEIDDYFVPCYLYECIAPLRALLMQKSAPGKYKKLMSLESHLEIRKNHPSWDKTQTNVIDVMKKTLGVMVFEALCSDLDLSDETIQRIQGIFDTNAIEIRLATGSEIHGLFEITSLLEHSCVPNVKICFDEKYNVTLRAGRPISKGEHLSIMYAHSLLGTSARREHLFNIKHFWCKCPRCADPTEMGTHFSTLIRDGQFLLPEDPLDPASQWCSKDKKFSVSALDVYNDMAEIGAQLAALQEKGSIEEFESFISNYSKTLHPNHYHMVTAKHSLMQMIGRQEGSLIQDIPMEQLQRKEGLCREMIDVCFKLDPCMVRLPIYAGCALYELHLPLLQYGKRKWETGEMPTEDFRKTLEEPHDYMLQAMALLKDEVNEKLPEGQLRLQCKDTLAQLEQFMKTIGCEL